MENMNKCPGCSQHCDRNNLQCGKGEAILSGEINPNSHRSHDHYHEGKRRCQHGGKHQGRGHHRPEFPAGSLGDLMSKCGHRLFHNGDETMFSVLTDEESTALKQLLNKLLSR